MFRGPNKKGERKDPFPFFIEVSGPELDVVQPKIGMVGIDGIDVVAELPFDEQEFLQVVGQGTPGQPINLAERDPRQPHPHPGIPAIGGAAGAQGRVVSGSA